MKDEQLQDEEIIMRIIEGETEMFQIIIEKYQNQIFGIGMRFWKNIEDALDFVQEVFLKVFEKLPSFRHESPFKFWLIKVAYHHGINSVKGQRKNIENFTEEEDSKYLPPEKALLVEETKKLLMSEIAKLPDKYSICLDLFFFSGLKYKEIEKITGIPQNTIKSHVYRAKKALANSLKGSIAEDYHDL